MPGLGKRLTLGPTKTASDRTISHIFLGAVTMTVGRNELGSFRACFRSVILVVDHFKVGLALTNGPFAATGDGGNGPIAGHEARIVPHPIAGTADKTAQTRTTLVTHHQWRQSDALGTAGNGLFVGSRYTPRRTCSRRKSQKISIVFGLDIEAPTQAMRVTAHAGRTNSFTAFGRVARRWEHFEVAALAMVQALATVATYSVEHAACGRITGQRRDGAFVGRDLNTRSILLMEESSIVRRVGNVLFRLFSQAKGGKPFFKDNGCRVASASRGHVGLLA